MFQLCRFRLDSFHQPLYFFSGKLNEFFFSKLKEVARSYFDKRNEFVSFKDTKAFILDVQVK